MKDLEHLQELEPQTWEQVLEAWRQREAGIWDAHIQENGYKDWEDFRLGKKGTLTKYGFHPLLSDLDWKRYAVTNTDAFVPNILAGPFAGWAIHNPRRDEKGQGIRESIAFDRIVDYGEIVKNERVQKILADLQTPMPPRLAIVLFAPDGKMLAPDGSHTLSAYALAARQALTLKTPLHVHGAHIKADHADYFNQLIRGEIPLQ